MKLLNFVRFYSLPIFMVIGVTGFILCVVADAVRNHYLRTIAQEETDPKKEIPFDEKAEAPAGKQPLKNRRFTFCLNLFGFMCMFASLIGLWHYGYFDPYLAMLFG